MKFVFLFPIVQCSGSTSSTKKNAFFKTERTGNFETEIQSSKSCYLYQGIALIIFSIITIIKKKSGSFFYALQFNVAVRNNSE